MLFRHPIAIMTIGLPATGKTTWRHNMLRAWNTRLPAHQGGNPVVISLDDEIEAAAASMGIFYADAFAELDVSAIQAQQMDKLRWNIQRGNSVIIDMTNLSAASRQNKLAIIPSDYFTIGVDFIMDESLRQQWQAGRVGKEIPEEVIEKLRPTYERPSMEEFDILFNGHRIRPHEFVAMILDSQSYT